MTLLSSDDVATTAIGHIIRKTEVRGRGEKFDKKFFKRTEV